MTLSLTLTLLLLAGVEPVKLPSLTDLTPPACQQLDRAALQTKPDKPSEQGVDLAGSLSGWLIQRVELTAEEEFAAATLEMEVDLLQFF